jgi:hypothetical protein
VSRFSVSDPNAPVVGRQLKERTWHLAVAVQMDFFLKVIGEQAALHLGGIFNVPEGFVALG